MRRLNREHEFDASKRAYGAAAAGGGISGHADDEIGAARGEGIPCSAEYLVGKPDARGGTFTAVVAVERCDERQQTRYIDRVVAGDAQFRLPAGGKPFDAMLEFARGAKQVSPLVKKFPPRRRERGAMSPAIEYQHIKIAFQFLHRVGQGRGDTVQLAGCGGKAATAVDGIEHLDGIERQAKIAHIVELF